MAVDVLFFCQRWNEPVGPGAACMAYAGLLQSMGCTCAAVDNIRTPDAAAAALDRHRPRLVLGGLQYALRHLMAVLDRYPDTAFAVRTTSHWAAALTYHEIPIQHDWMREVAARPNCWMLANSPEMSADLADCGRVLPFWNVYPLPQRRAEIRFPLCPLRIATVGRNDWTKSYPALALALRSVAARRRDATFHTWMRADGKFTAGFGIVPGWCAQPMTSNCVELREAILAQRINLCVQISLTETFCFAAADFLSLGIPVVGSRAITYIPPAWQVADESDPREVAAAVHRVAALDGDAVRAGISVYRRDQAARRRRMRRVFRALLGAA